jgi:TRAP-type C4-dicarboxylate transport system permease large subunit
MTIGSGVGSGIGITTVSGIITGTTAGADTGTEIGSTVAVYGLVVSLVRLEAGAEQPAINRQKIAIENATNALFGGFVILFILI